MKAVRCCVPGARVPLPLLLALLAALIDPTRAVHAAGLTYREMRYECAVGQTTEYSCGPAAVATLLVIFYGLDVREAEVLRIAEEHDAAAGREPGAGISAYALKLALASFGVPATGLLVTLQSLSEYFAQGGLPLVLHTTRPRMHYVVAIGVVDGQAVLADPGWGRRLLPMPDLETELGFDGVVLAPSPPGWLAERAVEVQRINLAWAKDRLAGLAALREHMLWP